MHSNFKSDRPSAADPQDIAIQVLGWLANEPDMLGRFLALSGTSPGQMRDAMNDIGFLAGMLDFLMSHEPTLMSFCEATDNKPETVVAAWQRLSGPGLSSGEY